MKVLSIDEIRNWPHNLGTTTVLVCEELVNRGWQIELFEQNNELKKAFFIARKGDQVHLLASIRTMPFFDLNDRLATMIAISKDRTYRYAESFGVRVPTSILVSGGQPSFDDLSNWPGIVIKPARGSSGKGITVGIKDEQAYLAAIETARKVDEEVIAQELIPGDDHRLLFVDYKLVAATKRVPAGLMGDGVKTVQQLIEANNNTPKGEGQARTEYDINIEEVRRLYGDELLSSVPESGSRAQVSDKANISQGGESHDVTDVVHPAYEAYLQPMIQSLGLGVCGIDILTTDVTADPFESNACLIEINTSPGFLMHFRPTEGSSRNPAIPVVDLIEKHN